MAYRPYPYEAAVVCHKVVGNGAGRGGEREEVEGNTMPIADTM